MSLMDMVAKGQDKLDTYVNAKMVAEYITMNEVIKEDQRELDIKKVALGMLKNRDFQETKANILSTLRESDLFEIING